MKNLPQQVDCDFKVVAVLFGAHVHVTYYVRERGQLTWQHTGKLIVGDNQYVAMRRCLVDMAQEVEEYGFES